MKITLALAASASRPCPRRRRLLRLRRGPDRRCRRRRRHEDHAGGVRRADRRARKSYAAQKQAFPKAGTPEFQSLQTQAVAFLVQRVQYEQQAEKLDVTVSEAEIDKRVEEVKKQYFEATRRSSPRS